MHAIFASHVTFRHCDREKHRGADVTRANPTVFVAITSNFDFGLIAGRDLALFDAETIGQKGKQAHTAKKNRATPLIVLEILK